MHDKPDLLSTVAASGSISSAIAGLTVVGAAWMCKYAKSFSRKRMEEGVCPETYKGQRSDAGCRCSSFPGR
eukprot:scaffold966_cov415-Prasinococcus_capsulatus_cf.AAC.19